MEKLGINLGFLIVQILNFVIILVVLVAWVYKPLMNAMKKRQEKVEQGLEDARIASDARANAEKRCPELADRRPKQSSSNHPRSTEKAEAANRDVRQAGETEIENYVRQPWQKIFRLVRKS